MARQNRVVLLRQDLVVVLEVINGREAARVIQIERLLRFARVPY